MIGEFLGVILFVALAAAVVACIYGFYGLYDKKTRTTKKNPKAGKIGIIMAPILLIMFIFIPFGFQQINPGEIGVVKVWGEAKSTKTEGLYFRFILSTQFQIYDLKTQEINAFLEAYSKDAQSMTAELTVQYRVQPDKAIDIAKQFGNGDILCDRIRAVSIERTKVILSSESAMDLIANRSTLSNRVEQSIKESIGQYYIDVTMVVVTDITFSDQFERTVEQKMIAEQEKLRAEYESEKAIIEAERDLEVAKLSAQADIEKAKGEGAAIAELAKAHADAIRVKAIEAARVFGSVVEVDIDGVTYEMLDATLLTDEQSEIILQYLEYIAWLDAWDGKLPDVVGGDLSLVIPKP